MLEDPARLTSSLTRSKYSALYPKSGPFPLQYAISILQGSTLYRMPSGRAFAIRILDGHPDITPADMVDIGRRERVPQLFGKGMHELLSTLLANIKEEQMTVLGLTFLRKLTTIKAELRSYRYRLARHAPFAAHPDCTDVTQCQQEWLHLWRSCVLTTMIRWPRLPVDYAFHVLTNRVGGMCRGCHAASIARTAEQSDCEEEVRITREAVERTYTEEISCRKGACRTETTHNCH